MSMETQGYLCDFCSEIFTEEFELANHVKDDHNLDWLATAEYSSSCESDGDGDQTDRSSLCSDQTRVSLPSSYIRRRAARIFSCDKCDYKTNVKASMKVHKLIHTLDCPYCQFKTVRQHHLKEHIISDHQTKMMKPDKDVWGRGAVSKGGEQFILGDIANQRLLNTIRPGQDSHSGDFSYIGDIMKPSVIVSKETMVLTNQALQFLAGLAGQEEAEQMGEQMVEVEESQIEVIVSDECAREIIGNVEVTDGQKIYDWKIV